VPPDDPSARSRTLLTRDDLLDALARIRVTAPVRADEVTGSTNATALEMAREGAPQWTLVAAAHQTEGRGRLGRSWEDVADRALLCSVVLRPDLAPNRAGLLSLLAGAAMAEAIGEVTGHRVSCKWPNDLLSHEHKVGGILLESSLRGDELDAVVVGVGVNLDPPEGVEGAAGIGDAPLRDLLGAFLVRVAETYTAQEPSWGERVKARWLPVSGTIGRRVRATTAEGAEVVGRAVGIDGFGGLRLSTDAGEAVVRFGEVTHLREEPDVAGSPAPG
jgi:BirA family transcriptional regulator, biotin operon repressor / biotin---[acetyl-CoA-carboxylase] ligase